MTHRQPFNEIERQIASLAPSITVGESSRDQMLDRARDSSTLDRGRKKTAQSIIIASLMVIVISPLIGSLTRVDVPSNSSAEEVHQLSLRDAEKKRQTFSWSLVDFFSQSRLGQSRR